MSNEPVQLPIRSTQRNRDTAEKGAEFHSSIKEAIVERFTGRVNAADLAVEQAQANFERVKAHLGDREPVYWRSPFSWLYWCFLGFLALAEVPVNRLSFQLFFAESPAVVLAVAALVGALFILLAHSAGMIMRRFRHASAEVGGAISSLARLLLVLTLITGLAYGVAIFRQAYLSFITQPDPSFATLMANHQVTDAALVVLKSTLAVDGAIFMCINLAIVSVGILLAFYRHDPHPNFEDLDRDQAKAQHALNKLVIKRDEEMAAEDRRYAHEKFRKGW